jgi:hypothetical protein
MTFGFVPVPDLKDRLLLREFAPELLSKNDTRAENTDEAESDDSEDELPVFHLLAQ